MTAPGFMFVCLTGRPCGTCLGPGSGGGTHLKSDGYVPTCVAGCREGAIGTKYKLCKRGGHRVLTHQIGGHSVYVRGVI